MNFTEENLKTYLKRLRKLRIKKLGAGAFSQVFQHPEFWNVAVKVFTGKDTVYKRYVQWCLKHQSNQYVPNIIEQHDIKSDSGEKYHIVFVEKMSPIQTVQKLVFELSKALELDLAKFEDLPLIKAFGQSDGVSRDDFKIIDEFVRRGRGDKNFRKIWSHIRSYGQDHFDLHYNNAMMRGTQLVLSDPVANDPTNRIDSCG